MKKTKLIAQFESLSSSEITALGKFLESPIYNKDKDITALFDFLKSNKKKKTGSYDRALYIKKCKPKKNFNKISSDLSILIEHFWVTTAILENEFSKRLSILREYRKRNLEDCFLRSFNDCIKFLETQSLRDDKYWRTMHLVLLEHLDIISSKKNRGNAESWRKVLQSFGISCFSSVMKMLCVSLTQESVSKEKFKTEIYEYLLDYVGKKSELLDNPSIAIYYYFYKAEQEPGNGHFIKMKNCIKSYGDQFSFDEKKHLYMLAISHCIKRYNKGEVSFLEQYIELCNEGLEKSILLDSGQISQFLYSNTVTTYCVLNRLDEAEDFTNKYKDFLDVKFREGVYFFCMGKILFYKNDYINAANALSQFKSSDVLKNMDVRIMLLKIAINDEPFDTSTEASLRNAITQLNRKKGELHEKFFNRYKSIFKSMNILLKYIVEPESDDEKLRSAIETIKPGFDRDWFLKQYQKYSKVKVPSSKSSSLQL